MGVILGIDIGGSATKIVGLRPDKSVIGMLRVKAEDSITSLYGALGSFLCSNDLTLGDLERIVLTGVGAADAKGDIYGVPTVRVEEFPSIGTGGLALSGKEHAVVVSLGTGTAFIWADQDGTVRHLGGSGIGGGTLAGLSSLITGTRQFSQIRKLACGGDLNKVDLTIGNMSRGSVGTLPPEATAANFANLSEDATPADLELGLINMVLQCIGTMSVFACQCCQTKTVVLTGALTMLPPAGKIFELFTQLYGVEFIIPENATFATAIGAALYSLRQDPAKEV
ncbi:MAG: pantothenate kinase [Oscillospiraceae bacterium]|nr:pantothenate kinase [Oscillospiraceae bacterium]MBQ2323862.1 pantothenate kinase [Oscillospiraceae bacterium]MBQ5443207.1 pantothenate kinase [Oscillospiraceae bacterium]